MPVFIHLVVRKLNKMFSRRNFIYLFYFYALIEIITGTETEMSDDKVRGKFSYIT